MTGGTGDAVVKTGTTNATAVRMQWRDTEDTVAGADADGLADHPFERSLPWRRATGFHGQRHRNGVAFMQSGARHCQFDSLTERRVLYAVDIDHTVAAAAAQPMRLEFPDACWHVPDYFLRHTDGSATLLDVKPDELVPRSAQQFDLTAVVADRLGWDYRVVPGPEPVLADNLATLSAYRHTDSGLDRDADAIVRVASAGPTTLGRLLGALSGLGDEPEVLPQVLHLLWHGRLDTDLFRPVDDRSALLVPLPGDLDRNRARTVRRPEWAWTPQRSRTAHRDRARAGRADGGAPKPTGAPQTDTDGPVPSGRWHLHTDAPPWWAADWDRVPEELRVRAEAIERVVNEMETGFASRDAATARPGEPRACFAAGVPVEDRLTAAGEMLRLALGRELPLSRAQMQRYRRARRRYGVAGLLDLRRVRACNAVEARHPAAFAACLAVIDDNVDRSGWTREWLVAQARQVLSRKGDDADLSDAESYRVAGAALKVRHAGGTARTRRSAASVGDEFGVYDVKMPGALVEIDHTPLDVFLTHRGVRMSLEISAAVDAASGCVLAYRLHDKGADGDDISFLLHDLLAEPALGVSRGLPWVGVPSGLTVRGVPVRRPAQVLVEDGGEPADPAGGGWTAARAFPLVRPQAVAFDYGAADASRQVRAACAALGITIHNARKRTGSDKPHVERFFGTLSRGFLQWCSAFKGANVLERGPSADGQPALTVERFDALVTEWLVTVHHARPRRYENVFGEKSVVMSPAEFVRVAGWVHGTHYRRADPDLRVELLRTHWAHIGREGVTVQGLVYNSRVLSDLRDRESTHRGQGGKWLFKVGLADRSRIWLRHPTRGWTEVPWRHADRYPGPLPDRGRRMLGRYLREAPSAGTEEQRMNDAVASLRARSAFVEADDETVRRAHAEADLQALLGGPDLPPAGVYAPPPPSDGDADEAADESAFRRSFRAMREQADREATA